MPLQAIRAAEWRYRRSRQPATRLNPPHKHTPKKGHSLHKDYAQDGAKHGVALRLNTLSSQR